MKQFGAIFDMDGVLIDSGPAHLEAFKEMGKRLGAEFSEEFFRNCFGFHNNQIFPLWLGPLSSERVSALADEKEALYREMAPKWVRPMPGVLALVKTLLNAGWKISVGSSGPRANVELAIGVLGLKNELSCAITGDDVEHGKPDPSIFLKAARGMGVPASQCVVFEDALAGIEASARAQMKCVAITSSLPREKIKAADWVISRFEEVDVLKLEALIAR